MLSGKQKGFTLLEATLAMSIGSLLMLAVAQLLPALRGQTQGSVRLFRLEQLLGQALFNVEKDLRRAGFCAGICDGPALTLTGSESSPCLTLAYDVNRNGRWEQGEGQEAEFFSYRLRNGALEVQTGRPRCQGSRWEKLFDPGEVTVTGFQVRQEGEGALYLLRLDGHWTSQPTVRQQLSRWVMRRNHDA